MGRLFQSFFVLAAIAVLPACAGDLDGLAVGCAEDCIADCDTSGCGGCDCACESCEDCSCGPIPGGFPKRLRLNNAAQVRISPSGFRFVERNILDIALPLIPDLDGISVDEDLTIALPRNLVNESSSDSGGGAVCWRYRIRARVCPNADECFVDLDIRDLDIRPLPRGGGRPHRIAVSVDAAFRSVNAAGRTSGLPVEVSASVGAGVRSPVTGRCIRANVGVNMDCDVEVNSNWGSNREVGLSAEVAIVEASTAASDPREGYGKLEVVRVALDPTIEDEDVRVSCEFRLRGIPSVVARVVNPIIDRALRPIISTMAELTVGATGTALQNQIDPLVQEVATVCQAALPDPTRNGSLTLCPTGSTANDGVCYLDRDPSRCVDLLLGAETRVDLGGLLTAIAPGLRASIDMLAAVQGEGRTRGGGYNLQLFGGFQNFGTSACIPADAPPPLDPPQVDLAPTFNDGDSSHFAFGLSEEVMNYAADQLWRSGALCLSASTSLDQLLSTGLFSLLIGSLNDLAFPSSGAAMGIVLRPQRAPVVTLGTGTEEDPFITIEVPQLALDFYVWSSERYVRFMTYTSDLMAQLNLPIANGTVRPEIVDVGLLNPVVTNNDLIREDAVQVSQAVAGIIPLALDMLGGAIAPIAITELVAGAGLPIGIDLNENSLRLVSDNVNGREERFLGVFIDLTTPSARPLTQRTDTDLELVSVRVPDATALELESFGEDDLPVIEIAMTASGPEGVEFEYQYRTDRGLWSEWSRSPYAVIEGGSLVLQGRHHVEARARVVGASHATDLSPARADFLIDVLAPSVETVASDESTLLRTFDVVTSSDALEYRFRDAGTSDEGWTEWRAVGDPEIVVADALGDGVEFQVRDEFGNIGSNTESLRGLPPPNDAGCDDCSVNGRPDPSRPLWALGVLVGLGALLRRPRD